MRKVCRSFRAAWTFNNHWKVCTSYWTSWTFNGFQESALKSFAKCIWIEMAVPCNARAKLYRWKNVQFYLQLGRVCTNACLSAVWEGFSITSGEGAVSYFVFLFSVSRTKKHIWGDLRMRWLSMHNVFVFPGFCYQSRQLRSEDH